MENGSSRWPGSLRVSLQIQTKPPVKVSSRTSAVSTTTQPLPWWESRDFLLFTPRMIAFQIACSPSKSSHPSCRQPPSHICRNWQCEPVFSCSRFPQLFSWMWRTNNMIYFLSFVHVHGVREELCGASDESRHSEVRRQYSTLGSLLAGWPWESYWTPFSLCELRITYESHTVISRSQWVNTSKVLITA